MAVPPGKLHGPGNVSQIPALFQRAAGIALGNADTSSVPRPGFGSQTSDELLDDDTLRFFVVGMTSGDPKIQRYLADNYTLPDVEFVHPAGATRGRDNFYHVYRAATTTLDYHVAFRDVIAGKGKACVWVDLKVKPRQFPASLLGRRTLPCLVILHFKRDPADGLTKLALQHDHFSFYGLYWQGGATGQQIAEEFIRPLLGKVLVANGHWAEFTRIKWQQAREALGLPPTSTDVLTAHRVSIDATSTSAVGATQRHGTSGAVLDRCIRQATSEISLSKIDEDDQDALAAALGVLGWSLRLARGVLGVCTASFIMFIASVLQFMLPLA